VEGIRELKQNKARANVFVAQRIEREGESFRQTFIGSMTGYTWIINAGTLLLYVSIGICVFLIPRSNAQTDVLLAQSTVILLYLIRPITGLMMLLPLIRQSGVALSRILQLTRDLGVRTEIPDAVNPFIAASLSLELCAVCYDRQNAASEATFSLGPINLTINRGDVVFIAGGNGSGKTTLVHLLLGLYHPSRGRIILNGHAVTDRNIHFYRELFSAILSDAFVFDFLVGPEHSTIEARAAQHLDRLRIAHKVDLLGTDLSTVELSSGQRKRLALVAAYVEDRPIFVFDEWAAEQEPDLKARFYREIVPNLKALGKTVLVITHDDAYFDVADVLVVLEDGLIREVRSKRSNAA
jgi:putative ATP-binding cassette transporter